jgi:hypothetical protein
MVDELVNRVPQFGCATSHTHCFLHIINLVAKSIICQFDVKKEDLDEIFDGDTPEIQGFDEHTIEGEEELTDSEDHKELQDRLLKDNNDGWIDKVELLSEEEHNTLEVTIWPVKLVLAKV